MKDTALLAIALLWLALLASCASREINSAGPPEDFALDVAVFALQPPGTDAGMAPAAHARTSRYVLLPGGALHTADSVSGEVVPQDILPAFTRTLSAAEVESLWNLVDRRGLADHRDQGAIVRSAGPIAGAADAPVCIVRIAARGRRYAIAQPFLEDAELSAELRDLVRSLAAMSWRSDAPVVDRPFAPRRYDFGPDPYARYRDPAPRDEEPADETDEL